MKQQNQRVVWLQVDSGETQSQAKFCTTPLAWKVPVLHIWVILLLHGLPLIYPLPLGGNIASCIFKLPSIALGIHHNFLHNKKNKKLLKYIYSISKDLKTVVRSAYSSKSFSLSNAIVHVLPQKIVTYAISPTPLLLSMTRSNASFFCSPISLSLLSSVLKIHYHRILKVYLSFHCYLTSLKNHWFLIPSCYLRPEVMLAHKNHTHLKSTIPNTSDQSTD
jgi:hypothetical protein